MTRTTPDRRPPSLFAEVGVVTIGRNEGQRLARCLDSVPKGLGFVARMEAQPSTSSSIPTSSGNTRRICSTWIASPSPRRGPAPCWHRPRRPWAPSSSRKPGCLSRRGPIRPASVGPWPASTPIGKAPLTFAWRPLWQSRPSPRAARGDQLEIVPVTRSLAYRGRIGFVRPRAPVSADSPGCNEENPTPGSGGPSAGGASI
jgi:hypothetical protein